MQKLKSYLKIHKYMPAIFLAMVASPVFGAELFFDAAALVRVGDEFETKLFVNSERENINAFEAKLMFSQDVLDLKDVRDGNSIVNFWIEKPKNKNNAVAFSGITPGGFNGDKGLILSVIFEAKKEGIAKLISSDVKILRNDGAGSAVISKTMPLEIVVSGRLTGEKQKRMEVKITDYEPPESFAPELARDENFLDGKWFVVFATQDKISGIDHYEIKEKKHGIFWEWMGGQGTEKWEFADSPYPLKDQELRSLVMIKAVDRAGNERIISLPPKHPLKWYENYVNWIIIIIGIAVILLARMRENKPQIKAQGDEKL